MNLKAESISRDYARVTRDSNVFTALRTTDLTLSAGELTVISGRSGGGKSTLLNILAGLLTPTTGKVFVDETDLYALSDDLRSRFRNEHIGVIPQGHTALRSLTVQENIALPLRMYGKDVGADGVLRLMSQLNIGHLRDAYPNELSGGELRRLSIARALLGSPDILLADEPTGDLDDMNTGIVFGLLRAYADAGHAVLVVTHETGASEFADIVRRMDDGSLTA